MTTSIGNRTKGEVKTTEYGLALVPFAFTVNGVTNPVMASNLGDVLQGVQVTRVSAGKWTFVPKNTAALVVGGGVMPMVADGVDIYGQIGNATDMTAPTVTVRTMTAAVATDPANGTVISGFLIVKYTTKRASQ